MKQKKGIESHINLMTLPPKRVGLCSANVSIMKRRQDTNEKQNNIQITEPLETLTYPSKQFIHSRQSFNRNSRPKLSEINQNTRNLVQHPLTAKKIQAQPQIYERRLSLKCTKNLSQQLESHLSHRLSMAPERESFGSSNRLPQSLLEERYSMGSSTVVRKDTKNSEGIKRQAIITNLMSKLDQEQDLRTIIESKLKGSASKDRRNQSYITDFTEDSGSSKIKQCQSQIKQFKNIIKEMSQKILELTSQEKNFKKKETNTPNKQLSLASLITHLTQLCNCKTKQTRSIGTQTQQIPKPPFINESCDFLSNLQKTLKVLDSTKH